MNRVSRRPQPAKPGSPLMSNAEPPENSATPAVDTPLRRVVLARAAAIAAIASIPRAASSVERTGTEFEPERRWHEAAAAMERLARSWGDQPFGAVVVAGGAVIGQGPSRVVKLGDPAAHAETEAIRDAQQRLGQLSLAGSVLYSTSRPCRVCEAAAAKANVARMVYGAELTDAGAPRH